MGRMGGLQWTLPSHPALPKLRDDLGMWVSQHLVYSEDRDSRIDEHTSEQLFVHPSSACYLSGTVLSKLTTNHAC